jgi:hypothetical protein
MEMLVVGTTLVGSAAVALGIQRAALALIFRLMK